MPLVWTSLILKVNSNVTESAVVKASPLIILSRAGLIDVVGVWVGDETEKVLQPAAGGVNQPPLPRHPILPNG